MPIGTISILTLPGDNDTWSVTLVSASGDVPLKSLRRADTWTSVVGACPLQAHWFAGEPLTDVLAMSGVVDRYRRFVVDGSPVRDRLRRRRRRVGVATNPSAGRGLTVGLQHAVRLRAVLRETADDPRALAERFDAVTEAEVTPWYRAQIASDRIRFAEIEALCAGREPPRPTDALASGLGDLLAAIMVDPDLFRAALEYIGTITTIQEILERPEVARRIAAATALLQEAPQMQLPGPSREQLLDLVR